MQYFDYMTNKYVNIVFGKGLGSICIRFFLLFCFVESLETMAPVSH